MRIVGSEKSYNFSSAIWRTRKPSGIIQCLKAFVEDGGGLV